MNKPTWHIGKAKQVLDSWYEDMDVFLDLAKGWDRFKFEKELAGECRRNALMCKTLGLVYHDRYKLLLDYK